MASLKMIPNPRTIIPSKRTLYVSVEGGEFFIPFVDATAPAETYGAGCFLKPEDLGGGQLTSISTWPATLRAPTVIVDPARSLPKANRIAVRIEAGE